MCVCVCVFYMSDIVAWMNYWRHSTCMSCCAFACVCKATAFKYWLVDKNNNLEGKGDKSNHTTWKERDHTQNTLFVPPRLLHTCRLTNLDGWQLAGFFFFYFFRKRQCFEALPHFSRVWPKSPFPVLCKFYHHEWRMLLTFYVIKQRKVTFCMSEQVGFTKHESGDRRHNITDEKKLNRCKMKRRITIQR